MVTRRSLLQTGLAAGAIGVPSTSTSVARSSAQEDSDDSDSTGPDSFVERAGQDLAIDDKQWYFSGSNNFWVTDPYTSARHGEQVVAEYGNRGFDVMRTWAFGENQGGDSFQASPREYSEAALRKLDRTIAAARKYDVRLILTFVDYWSHYGGMRQYEAWAPELDVDADASEKPTEQFYTNEFCRNLYKDWMEQVLTRENTITGTEYRNEEAIFAFELANEPRAESADSDDLHQWFVEMSAHFKSLDDNHLLTTGMEGFYDINDEEAEGDDINADRFFYDGSPGTEYIRNHRIDDIDLCTFHMYPDAWGMSETESKEWIRRHVSDAHETIGKPVYCGEFGTVSQDGRANRFEKWYDVFDTQDANGALVWMVIKDDSGSSKHEIGLEEESTMKRIESYTRTVRQKSGGSVSEDQPSLPDPPEDSDAFVHECGTLDTLGPGTDTESLRVDTSNHQYFDRPNGGTNGSRITRVDTTDRTRLVYDLDVELDFVRVEIHRNENVSDGGRVDILESSDGGESYSAAETEESEFGDVGDGGWVAVNTEVTPSRGTDQLAIDLVGGSQPWSPQIGRVIIETGAASSPDEPANEDAFVDECTNLVDLASGADSEPLRVDTSNTRYFDRPNGGLNGSRITRKDTTDRTRVLYDLETELDSFRVETHRNGDAGGEVRFLASTDGGQSFEPVETEESEFGDVGDGEWVAINHNATLPAGTDQLAIDLVGGSKPWSPQIGRVIIETGAASSPDEPTNEDAFVDECGDLDELTDAADRDILRIDTSNPGYFDRPNGGSNGARITRDGTTSKARLVYSLDREIDAVRVESHMNYRAVGQLTFLESTDGGESYATIATEDSTFGDIGAGNWVATNHEATLSDGADRFAIELSGGNQPWSPQIGRVILEPGDEKSDDPGKPNDPGEPNKPDDPSDPDKPDTPDESGLEFIDRLVSVFD